MPIVSSGRLTGLLVLAAHFLAAQTPSPTTAPVVAATSVAATYATRVSATDLKKHLRILAADDMEGRETGTRGQKKAADYIARQFADMGLAPVAKQPDGTLSYLQPFTLYKKTWGNFYLRAGGKTYTYLTDF